MKSLGAVLRACYDDRHGIVGEFRKDGGEGVLMTRKKLPIGTHSFHRVREGGYYYVAKTRNVRELIDRGEAFFLSRPRRFGKSLFLRTLQELFECNEELFRGLYIHDHWD